MAFDPSRIAGVLLDLDGTLYVGEAALPGAAATLARLREAGYPLRFVTNTTRFRRSELVERLASMGLDVPAEDLFTAPRAAAAWLRREGLTRVQLYVPESTVSEFDGLERVERDPQAIVVGDLGRDFSWERLNRAFHALLDGARLVALQRNRYWRSDEGLVLDGGPFVAALEYAAGVEATLAGKPSPAFFDAAAASIPLPPGRCVMIGDDLPCDVGGAQAVGAAGVLVRTGKFRAEELERSTVRPDGVLDSIADLPDWLGC